MSSTALADLTRTIQLAVAPVFLLTALGTILSVLSTRLGRIVDRLRVVATRHDEAEPHKRAQYEHELGYLVRRRDLINYAVTSATMAALQVCILIAIAFVGFLVQGNYAMFIAGLFIGAMGAFILALLLFLREVLMAVSSTRLVTR